MPGARKALSADSHVAEIDASFAQIDPKYRDARPRATFDPERGGALFDVPHFDLALSVPMGLVCTAGRSPAEFGTAIDWNELHAGGFDGKARLEVQDEEAIGAEIIYPSLGLVLCGLPDLEYRKACFEAYNRWLLEFSEPDRERLVTIPLISLRTPEEGVQEIKEAARLGFKGVMFPGHTAFEDYDHSSYDPVWEACVGLDLPVSFHILSTPSDTGLWPRGPRIIQHMIMSRGIQDIMSMLIFGAVFERHPKLHVVCAEADAGWIPHFKFRLDHAFEIHRHWQQYGAIRERPSHYFDQNIFVTFQNDFSLQHTIGGTNAERLLWASDFPHGDGTYPRSRQVIARFESLLDEACHGPIFRDNLASLYKLSA
ncbi:MAG: amidohydrolase [Deltaproteobacteria bacterium]|nr:amidohydrolase [Deltaproteobacteria bacterium]